MIPLSTTTIRVERPEAAEPNMPRMYSTIASGVRAHISAASGIEQIVGGEQVTLTDRLACETVDLTYLDRVVDENTDETYEVMWARSRRGLGVDHTSAGLRQVVGVVPR